MLSSLYSTLRFSALALAGLSVLALAGCGGSSSSGGGGASNSGSGGSGSFTAKFSVPQGTNANTADYSAGNVGGGVTPPAPIILPAGDRNQLAELSGYRHCQQQSHCVGCDRRYCGSGLDQRQDLQISCDGSADGADQLRHARRSRRVSGNDAWHRHLHGRRQRHGEPALTLSVPLSRNRPTPRLATAWAFCVLDTGLALCYTRAVVYSISDCLGKTRSPCCIAPGKLLF
jgi:hypothetical protein